MVLTLPKGDAHQALIEPWCDHIRKMTKLAVTEEDKASATCTQTGNAKRNERNGTNETERTPGTRTRQSSVELLNMQLFGRKHDISINEAVNTETSANVR